MRSVSVARTLRKARPSNEKRMRAACVVRRPVPDEAVEDPLTGVVTPAFEVEPVYGPGSKDAGKCYLRYPGLAYESKPEAGGFSFSVSRVVVRVPFGPIFQPGDVITVLADPDNPQLVGTVLRVASVDDMSQAAAQRLLCEDYQVGVNR